MTHRGFNGRAGFGFRERRQSERTKRDDALARISIARRYRRFVLSNVCGVSFDPHSAVTLPVRSQGNGRFLVNSRLLITGFILGRIFY